MKLKHIFGKISVMICLLTFLTLEVIPVTAVAGTSSGIVQWIQTRAGLNHPVKSVISYGNRLNVQGNSRDWFYVILPDGSDGWVMTRFVSVPDTGAKG